MAGTLGRPDQDAVRLAAAGAAVRARHGLVTPPWLTVAVAAQQQRGPLSNRPETSALTDNEAVALALT